MENNNNWKSIVWAKIVDFLLDFPEFMFLLKIAAGVLVVVIAYFLIKFFTKV